MEPDRTVRETFKGAEIVELGTGESVELIGLPGVTLPTGTVVAFVQGERKPGDTVDPPKVRLILDSSGAFGGL